jgi:hypothetical protein
MNKVNHSLGAIIIIFLSLFQKLAVGLVGVVRRGGKGVPFPCGPTLFGRKWRETKRGKAVLCQL